MRAVSKNPCPRCAGCDWDCFKRNTDSDTIEPETTVLVLIVDHPKLQSSGMQSALIQICSRCKFTFMVPEEWLVVENIADSYAKALSVDHLYRLRQSIYNQTAISSDNFKTYRAKN